MTFYDLDGRESTENENTGSEVNGQQNNDEEKAVISFKFIFNSKGKYVDKKEIGEGKESFGIMLNDEGNEKLRFDFADPIHDSESIISGDIKTLYFPTKEEIMKDLNRAGVLQKKHHGLIKGIKYLRYSSNSGTDTGHDGGKLDFVVKSNLFGQQTYDGVSYGLLTEDYLYVTQDDKGLYTAHNLHNYGNFLWGASVKSLGLPLIVGRIGAHLNNFFNEPSNYSKSFFKKELDSKDDQLSIKLGWKWAKFNIKK